VRVFHRPDRNRDGVTRTVHAQSSELWRRTHGASTARIGFVAAVIIPFRCAVSALAQTATANLSVSATVISVCLISTTPVSFGSFNVFSAC
jgi:spore coat protein U-like protein